MGHSYGHDRLRREQEVDAKRQRRSLLRARKRRLAAKLRAEIFLALIAETMLADLDSTGVEWVECKDFLGQEKR